MLAKLESGYGATARESAEEIVEKDEQSTKPHTTINDVEKAESSTHFGQTKNDKNDGIIKDRATSPKLLRNLDGSSCIFRIPQSLKKIHHKGYEPEVVSIGPYHHKKTHLQMIEEHKHRFLYLFFDEISNVPMDVLEKEIENMENTIRNSYSEKLVWFDGKDLINMMLLDGCFILMLLFFDAKRIDAKIIDATKNDPILKTPWILPAIRNDLLLLENQVPFTILETLFKKSKCTGFGSLDDLALSFFFKDSENNPNFCLPERITPKVKVNHLLDLVRTTLLPLDSTKESSETSSSSQSASELFLSAKRLRLKGIQFRAYHESHAFDVRSPLKKTILDIQLSGAEVQIPRIVFDEFTSLVLLNGVAFEQLSINCSNHITSYIVFMGCLLNDEADVSYLSDKGIIENYFGNGSDVSQFFKTMSNGIVFDMSNSHLKEVFKGINKYTSKRWNVEYASFKHLHFDSPWACMSSSAILAILLLTIFQATFSGLSYLRPPSVPSPPPPPSG